MWGKGSNSIFSHNVMSLRNLFLLQWYRFLALLFLDTIYLMLSVSLFMVLQHPYCHPQIQASNDSVKSCDFVLLVMTESVGLTQIMQENISNGLFPGHIVLPFGVLRHKYKITHVPPCLVQNTSGPKPPRPRMWTSSNINHTLVFQTPPSSGRTGEGLLVDWEKQLYLYKGHPFLIWLDLKLTQQNVIICISVGGKRGRRLEPSKTRWRGRHSHHWRAAWHVL